jgi:aryl-alcohol dehydrogenase-like predicted oxidoreductase
MLGTVQFGLPYGVANRTGQPSYEEVRAIVAAAVDGGVTAFDTAAAYGTSEEVLGRALHELGVADRVVVITKVRHLTPVEIADRRVAAKAVEVSVVLSRRRLRLDCLSAVLFHREADAVHMDALYRLKSKGWLRQVGISCDNRPGPAARFAGMSAVGALQIPANVLDRRHLRAGSLEAALARGVAVFVRSVYLQGLLLLPESEVPEALRPVIPVRRTLAAIAGEAGMTLAELAVRYMLGQPGVTSVLAGVETVAQARENIAMFGRGPLPPDVQAAVDATASELPETVLTPSMWPR